MTDDEKIPDGETLDDRPDGNPIDRLLAEQDAAPWTDSGSGPGWLVCQHMKYPTQCEKCRKTPDD